MKFMNSLCLTNGSDHKQHWELFSITIGYNNWKSLGAHLEQNTDYILFIFQDIFHRLKKTEAQQD